MDERQPRPYDLAQARRKHGDSISEAMLTLGEVIPDRPALLYEDSKRTHRQLLDRMRRVAGYLSEHGVSPGDRVAIQLDNRPEFFDVAGGILMAGGILVALNVMYQEEEIRHILSNCGARALFTLDALEPRSRALRKDLPELEHTVVVGSSAPGCEDFDRVVSGGPAARIQHRGGDDIALLQYTSGTTGKPKGAMITHRNVLSCLDMMARIENSRFDEEDVMLMVLPLFHSYGLSMGFFGCTIYGVPTVLLNRFDPTEVFRLFEQHRVTIFFGAPPMYVSFVNTPGLADRDVSSLRVCGSGAAPLPVPIMDRFKELTGVQVMEGYGLTESAPTIATNAMASIPKPGTVGKPLRGVEVRIIDEQGRDLGPGQVGELIARGENIFAGYWNDPEASREALREGWLHTGDMAKVDKEGFITIVDRKKDMILVSGFNVYPIEVENVLFAHPKIADAAVIGVPHPYQGESVKAFVVLQPDVSATEEEIIDWVRDRLAAFKCPKSVAFVDSLPKNRTGKVLKRELRSGRA